MKAYNGFKAESSSSREQLPIGGYVCKIIGAKEVSYDWGSVLEIGFDVAEGDYRGFFDADYKANQNEDKKWRGVFRLRIPNDDGTEQDGWTKRSFNNAIWAIEESNEGYHWDWNEKSLKDKLIGLIFRNEEWEYNGFTGWTSRAAGADSVARIREGKFKQLKDKPLKNAPKATMAAKPSDDDDDLPF